MAPTRRDFIRQMGAGLAGAGAAAGGLACADQGSSVSSDSERLLVDNPDHVEPAPLGMDRLPLEWHQQATRRLKVRVAERGIDALLLTADQNQAYFTGCFRRSGERSNRLSSPREGELA